MFAQSYKPSTPDIVTSPGASPIFSCSSTSLCVFSVVSRVKSECELCSNPLQTMLVGSGAVITKRHTEYAVGGLLGVVVIQAFGYGLIFDLNFFLRNLSVIGGLLMVFSDSMLTRKKLFAGLPSLSENDRKK